MTKISNVFLVLLMLFIFYIATLYSYMNEVDSSNTSLVNAEVDDYLDITMDLEGHNVRSNNITSKLKDLEECEIYKVIISKNESYSLEVPVKLSNYRNIDTLIISKIHDLNRRKYYENIGYNINSLKMYCYSSLLEQYSVNNNVYYIENTKAD